MTSRRTPFRIIVAPFVRDANYFIDKSGFHPRECKIVTRIEQLRGYDFRDRPGRPPNNGWEVWLLTGHWPLHTRKDIDKFNQTYAYLKYVQGADVRRWYT